MEPPEWEETEAIALHPVRTQQENSYLQAGTSPLQSPTTLEHGLRLQNCESRNCGVLGHPVYGSLLTEPDGDSLPSSVRDVTPGQCSQWRHLEAGATHGLCTAGRHVLSPWLPPLAKASSVQGACDEWKRSPPFPNIP